MKEIEHLGVRVQSDVAYMCHVRRRLGRLYADWTVSGQEDVLCETKLRKLP